MLQGKDRREGEHLPLNSVTPGDATKHPRDAAIQPATRKRRSQEEVAGWPSTWLVWAYQQVPCTRGSSFQVRNMVLAASIAPESVQEGSWHCHLALMHCSGSVRSTKFDQTNDLFVLTLATEEYLFSQPIAVTRSLIPSVIIVFMSHALIKGRICIYPQRKFLIQRVGDALRTRWNFTNINCPVANGVSCKLATLSQVQTEANITRVHLSMTAGKPEEFVLFLHMLLGIKYST